MELPEPPATEVVNAAIHFFAILFPLQSSRVQESILEQLKIFMGDSSLQRDPARKEAISVNTAMALLGALKVAVKDTSLPSGEMKNETVDNLIKQLLRVSAQNGLRMSSKSLGLLDTSGSVCAKHISTSFRQTCSDSREPFHH